MANLSKLMTKYNIEKMCQRTSYAKHFLKWLQSLYQKSLNISLVTTGATSVFVSVNLTHRYWYLISRYVRFRYPEEYLVTSRSLPHNPYHGRCDRESIALTEPHKPNPNQTLTDSPNTSRTPKLRIVSNERHPDFNVFRHTCLMSQLKKIGEKWQNFCANKRSVQLWHT
eukprot:sb/3472275/